MTRDLGPLAQIGLTVWLLCGLACSDDTGCASNAPSLLAVKVETQSTDLAVLEDDLIARNLTNGSNVTLEGLVKNNVQDNMKEINALPNLENRSNETGDETQSNETQGNGTVNGTTGNGTSQSTRPRHGFGELAVNLEFITLKLAQLETVAELQLLRNCCRVDAHLTVFSKLMPHDTNACVFIAHFRVSGPGATLPAGS